MLWFLHQTERFSVEKSINLFCEKDGVPNEELDKWFQAPLGNWTGWDWNIPEKDIIADQIIEFTYDKYEGRPLQRKNWAIVMAEGRSQV